MNRLQSWWQKLGLPLPDDGELDTTNLLERMFPAVAFWQVVFLIAFTVLMSMWNLDIVREAVFATLSQGRQDRAIEALRDPSDEVAAQACYTLLDAENSTYYAYITDVLYTRPQVSFACLGRASEARGDAATQAPEEAAEPTNAPNESDSDSLDFSVEDVQTWPDMSRVSGGEDFVPNYVLVASTLGSRWMSDLIRGNDNTCQTALNTRRALDLARVDPTYRMMTCALGADSAEVRECCVAQLGGHEAFVELLDDTGRVPLIAASFDYRALVGSAFPEVPLASELLGRRYQSWQAEVAVPSAEALAERGEERFGNLQYNAQDWVVEVGCDIHYNLPSRGLVPAAFVPLVEAKGCGPTSPPWAGMYSPASWSDMCMGMYQARRKMGATPREAICDSLASSTVGRSVVSATMVVAGAISSGTQIRGVRRKKIELSGDNFGDRVFNPHSEKSKRIKKRDREGAPWAADPYAVPMYQ